MGKLITAVIELFRNHKLKVATAFVAFLMFLVLLFPFSDLSDLVTAQVAKLTQNQIFLQFDDPGLSLFPAPGLSLENVRVETPFGPPVKASEISISPSILSLLSFRLGVSLRADDIFGGDLNLSTEPGKKRESVEAPQKFSVDGSKLDVLQISKMSGIPVQLKGRMDLQSDGEVDLAWKGQPAVNLKLAFQKLQVPPDTVPTPMGPLALPDVLLSVVNIEGELKDGKLMIQKGVLGQGNDELVGQIQGQMDLNLVNSGGRPSVIPGGYDFSIRLNIKESLAKKAQLFLIAFEKGKKPPSSPGLVTYAFKLSAPSVNSVFKITPL